MDPSRPIAWAATVGPQSATLFEAARILSRATARASASCAWPNATAWIVPRPPNAACK